MDSNYGDVGQSWRMSSQAPLDSKSMVNRLSDLTDISENRPFRYYRGMRVYCHQNKKTYEWTDQLVDGQTKLLQNNYVYPAGSQYDGVVYAGLEFNFVEVLTQYFVPDERSSFLENEGTGVDYFNGINPQSKNSKIARTNSNTLKITKQGDGSVNSEIDVFNGGNEGISLYEFFPGNKTHAIRKLHSKNLILTINENGYAEINYPDGGSTSNNWYIDPLFKRPINWGDPIQNPKEKINGVDVPDGTLNDPFKTWDEYLLKVIGGTGIHNGTVNFNGYVITAGKPYSKIFPKHIKKLVFLSSVTTDKDCEVNLQTYEFLNNSSLSYNGTNDYSIDTRRLWNIMPLVGGIIEIPIYMGFINPIITNLSKSGVIYHKTDKTKTNKGLKSFIEVVTRNSNARFYETGSKVFTELKNEAGQSIEHGSYNIQGNSEAPNTPIVVIEGENSHDWGAAFIGNFPVEIISNTETNLELRNGGFLYCGTEFRPFANQSFVGYEKKLYTGLPGMSDEEIKLVNFFGGLYFKPYRDRNIISIKGNSFFRANRIANDTDAALGVGVNSFCRLDGGRFSIDDSMDSVWATSSTCVFDYSTADNSVVIGNGFYDSQAYYFLKGDGSTISKFVLQNFNVRNVEKIQENTGDTLINTAGTWSTIKQVAFNTQISSHPNHAAAKTAGLITGSIFFNTTINALDRVV